MNPSDPSPSFASLGSLIMQPLVIVLGWFFPIPFCYVVVCMHVCGCVHVCAYPHVCKHIVRSQLWVSFLVSVDLIYSFCLILFWFGIAHWNRSSLNDWTNWLVSIRDLSVSSPSALRAQQVDPCTWLFWCGCWGNKLMQLGPENFLFSRLLQTQKFHFS